MKILTISPWIAKCYKLIEELKAETQELGEEIAVIISSGSSITVTIIMIAFC